MSAEPQQHDDPPQMDAEPPADSVEVVDIEISTEPALDASAVEGENGIAAAVDPAPELQVDSTSEPHASTQNSHLDEEKEVVLGEEVGKPENVTHSVESGDGAQAVPSILGSATSAPKKFTSLNVNKRFLEKASPALPSSSAPISAKSSTPQSTSRLSSITPASRLTSAKLTNTVKPQPVGWGSIASPTASAVADPLSGAVGASASSPRLVTALTGGAGINRSVSPLNKANSPGLRNAAIASSGRSPAPAAIAVSTTVSSKTPWARMRADAPSAPTSRPSRLVSDFPTAAEAARAKQEAEMREKAAAAEAAARAEAALQRLERFRGTSLGPGNHWDDMDDEDDLDEIVQFGDGTQYKVPAAEPVTKEERFKDVGHDRSWPPKASDVKPPMVATAERPALVTRQSSHKEAKATPVPTVDTAGAASAHRPSRVTVTKMEIRGAEGVSLDTAPPDRGGYGGFGGHHHREAPSFFRGRDRDGDHGQGQSTTASTLAPPARAWGPLANRQASLNPDAPKPPGLVKSPPQAHASVQQESAVPPPPSQPDASIANADTTIGKSGNLPTSKPDSTSDALPTQRALPPHMTSAWNRPTSPSSSQPQSQAASRDVPSVVPDDGRTAAPADVPSKTSAPGEGQREEMLSAAERARKRRQEEEERRNAERERAKAKAAMIEEQIRLAQEQKEKEELERKRKAEEKVLLKRKEREDEEAQKRAAREEQDRKARADAEKAKESHRAGIELSSASVKAANDRALSRQQQQQTDGASLLSPSDEAISWRRAKPISIRAPGQTDASMTSRAKAEGDAHSVSEGRSVTYDAQGSQQQKLTLLQRPAGRPNASEPVKEETATGLASNAGDNAARQASKLATAKVHAAPKAAEASAREGGNARVRSITDTEKGQNKAAKIESTPSTDKVADHPGKVEATQRAPRPARDATTTAPDSAASGSAARVAQVLRPENPVTRPEVTFDAVPVWNRFRIKIGSSPVPIHPSSQQAKAQAQRVANHKNSSIVPEAVEVLSWEPPIAGLSYRTLSRDDLFFQKKYRRGVLVTNVSIPTTRLDRTRFGDPAADRPIVRMPASRQKGRNLPNGTERGVIPSPAAVESNHSTQGDRKEEKADDAAELFTSSKLVPDGPPLVSLPSRKKAVPKEEASTDRPLPSNKRLTPVTPSTSSTWGQSALSFAGLDPAETGEQHKGPAVADQLHIKNVWASPNIDSVEFVPKQNSLQGIVDDLPSTLTISMQDLRSDEERVTNTHQSNSRVSTEREQSHADANSEGGHTTRLYSPLTRSDEALNGGYPSFRYYPSPSSAANARLDAKYVSPTSPSYRSSSHQSPSVASSAFSAYNYPSPITEMSAEGPIIVDSSHRHMPRYDHRRMGQSTAYPRQNGDHFDADMYSAYDYGQSMSASGWPAEAFLAGDNYRSMRSRPHDEYRSYQQMPHQQYRQYRGQDSSRMTSGSHLGAQFRSDRISPSQASMLHQTIGPSVKPARTQLYQSKVLDAVPTTAISTTVSSAGEKKSEDSPSKVERPEGSKDGLDVHIDQSTAETKEDGSAALHGSNLVSATEATPSVW